MALTERILSRQCLVSAKDDTIRVVNDQIGTPTYTFDLARLLVDMIETEKYGYYHATNEGGYISWYDFTCEIFRQAGKDTKVIPVTKKSTVFPRQPDRLTAVWINVSWWKMDLNRFLPGRMR